MKKLFVVIIVCIVLISSVVIYLFYDDSPKETVYDNSGNLVVHELSPYYNYVEKFSSDEKIQKYIDSMYVSDDNSDYMISIYEYGVCINKYLGKEKTVIIPEEIDGMPVVKLGNYYIKTEYGFKEYSSFYGTQIESIYLPSKLKEIVYPTFFQINIPESFSDEGLCDPEEVEDTLKSITVSKENSYYFSCGGVLFSKTTCKALCFPKISYYM